MKDYLNLIPLIIIISLLLYFCYTRKYKQFFSPLDIRPSLIFERSEKLLWINQNLEAVTVNTDNFTTEFQQSPNIFYTNRSINYENDKFIGFYFKPKENLKNISVGLQNADIRQLSKNFKNLDFSFKFIGNHRIQIQERTNPYLTSAIKSSNSYLIENIDYCNQLNEKVCLGKRNVIQLEKNDSLGIFIHQNRINYVIIQEYYDTTDETLKRNAILIHKSKNKFAYPLYPTILNKIQKNGFHDFNWLSSGIAQPPSFYSAELLNPIKYEMKEMPPQISINTFSPQPSISISESEAPGPTATIFPWDRKIEIQDATLYNKVINIYLKALNIEQDYLDRLYGVNILLSPEKTKNKKKLSIPYMPILKTEKLRLSDNNIINLELNIEPHLVHFYQKNIIIEVILRLGEFTDSDNIKSNTYTLEF